MRAIEGGVPTPVSHRATIRPPGKYVAPILCRFDFGAFTHASRAVVDLTTHWNRCTTDRCTLGAYGESVSRKRTGG